MDDGHPPVTTHLWERSEAAEAPLAGQTHTPRRRWLLLAGLVVAVLAAGLLFVSQGPGPATTAALDPRNPQTSGAQALATVLADHGARVDVARGELELSRAGVDGNTTVFVPRTTELAESTTRNLARLTNTAERLVVLAPDRPVLQALSPSVGVTQVRRGEQDLVAADCPTSDIRPGETLSRSQAEFSAPRTDATCFTRDRTSVYMTLPRSAGSAPLVLLGSTAVITNGQITEASNAAIVLRILGHSGRVVWYVPSLDDVDADETGPEALIPKWIGPGSALVAVAFLGVMLWRGRRLGRLVPEPLPVVVRAAETTESRGRLYRQARDAARAAAVLQSATRGRLADYLGMPRPSSTVSSSGADRALVAAVAAATGRRPDEVGALLFGPPPIRDEHLLGFSVELANLEKEVRRV